MQQAEHVDVAHTVDMDVDRAEQPSSSSSSSSPHPPLPLSSTTFPLRLLPSPEDITPTSTHRFSSYSAMRDFVEDFAISQGFEVRWRNSGGEDSRHHSGKAKCWCSHPPPTAGKDEATPSQPPPPASASKASKRGSKQIYCGCKWHVCWSRLDGSERGERKETEEAELRYRLTAERHLEHTGHAVVSPSSIKSDTDSLPNVPSAIKETVRAMLRSGMQGGASQRRFLQLQHNVTITREVFHDLVQHAKAELSLASTTAPPTDTTSSAIAAASEPPAAPTSSAPPVPPAAAPQKVLCEGKARIPFTGDEGVFYNKVQVFNRDLSILAISTFTQRRQREWDAHQQKRPSHRPRNPRPSHIPSSNPIPSPLPEPSHDVDLPTEPLLDSPSPPEEEKAMEVDPSPRLPLPFPGIRILEALSATGLRSIRYFLEIPSVSHILVNDFDLTAVSSIRANVAFNGLSLSDLQPSHGDAKLVMYQHVGLGKSFDVIDLDPYGSACEFLDASVQAVSDGGLLAITCTDKAVLCGAWGEVSYAKYGGYSLKGKTCHEMAIRLVLGAIQSAAARYRRYIEPVLSLSIDFYVRVFVRVRESQLQVKATASRSALVYQCMGCEAFYLQRMGRIHQAKDQQAKHTAAQGPPCPTRCPDCQSAFRVGGPVWADALHDPAFIDEALASLATEPTRFATHVRIQAMLGVARKELPVPLCYSLSNLCHVLHCVQPKIWVIRAGLINAGYECSDTHALPDGMKTTAPPSVVWDVMRAYIKANPDAKGKHLTPDSPAAIILSKEPSSAHSSSHSPLLTAAGICSHSAPSVSCVNAQNQCGLQLRQWLRLIEQEHGRSLPFPTLSPQRAPAALFLSRSTLC